MQERALVAMKHGVDTAPAIAEVVGTAHGLMLKVLRGMANDGRVLVIDNAVDGVTRYALRHGAGVDEPLPSLAETNGAMDGGVTLDPASYPEAEARAYAAVQARRAAPATQVARDTGLLYLDALGALWRLAHQNRLYVTERDGRHATFKARGGRR